MKEAQGWVTYDDRKVTSQKGNILEDSFVKKNCVLVLYSKDEESHQVWLRVSLWLFP